MASLTERNYLFGMMAFQQALIEREKLLEAFGVWGRRRSSTIAEIFVELQLLGSDTVSRLNELVDRCLDRHQGDFERCLVELGATDQLLYELRSRAEPDLLATLPPSPHGTSPMDTSVSVASDPSVAAKSVDARHRYQTLRPHAKGGLGEVFIAQDSELNREVALKEIQARYADNPNSRERFILEAEITGSLEHPGIVPVYGLGQYGDGRPFYAMRFVKGDTLKDAIEQFHLFHSDCDFRTGEASIEFRRLLQHFIDVCETIEYAHSRGVLHRDLKPANIMLGKFGETLVVDWGLAKVIGRAEKYRASPEATITPESGSGSARTKIGSALGTPAFMSPEQAAGKLNDLGPAADVYSLGATFYCLLTGRLPFGHDESIDASTLLQKVQQGDFPKPRSVQPKIPRALESVCLKAMSIRPSDRHSSPQELSSELERWLADEPLRFYTEPLVTRLTRLGRRHRTLLWSSVASLFIVALVASIAAVIVNDWRRTAENLALQEIQQRQAAQLERDRAVTAEKKLQVAAEETEQSLYLAQIHVAGGEWIRGGIQGMARVLAKASPQRRGFEWNYLDAQAKQDLLVYDQHHCTVKALALSPDNSIVLTGDANGELHAWQLANGETIFHTSANRWDINALAFHPSGKQFAVAGHLGKLALWDLATQRELLEFRGHPAQVFDVAFHPNGQMIASAGADQSVRLWNSTNGQQLQALAGHRLFATTVAFSPDGKRLASGGQDGEIFLWDVQTGAMDHTLVSTKGPVAEIAISPDGNLLASVHELPFTTSDLSTRLIIWDLATQQIRHELELQQGSTMALAFSPDSMFVASGADDGTVHVVNVNSGRSEWIHRGHTGRVWDVQFSSDGKLLASCGADGTARIRTAMTDSRFTPLSLPSSVQQLAVAYGPTTEWIAIGKESGATLLSTVDGSTLGECRDEQGATMSLATIAIDAKGSRVAALSHSQQQVTLWDAVSKRLIGRLAGHSDAITAVRFSPDGKMAFTSSRDGTLRAWDTTTFQQTRLYQGSRFPVQSIAVDPAGTFLVSVTGEKQDRLGLGERSLRGEVLVWALTDPTSPKRLGDDEHAYQAVAISPESKSVAAAREDGVIDVLEVAGSQGVAKLVGHTGAVNSVAFFPDGLRLASAGADRTIRIWDLKTAEQLLELRGHRYPIQSLAISPDGRELVSAATGAGLQSEILLWRSDASRESRQRQMQMTYQPAWYRQRLLEAANAQHAFATRWFAKALDQAEPRSAANALFCADQMIKLHLLEDAEQWCDRSIQYDAALPDGYRLKGSLCEKTERLSQAIAAYTLYLERASHDADMWFHLASLQSQAGNIDDSIGSLQKALRVRPEFAEAHCDLGHLFVRSGRLDEAIEELVKGHELGTARNRSVGNDSAVPAATDWPYPSQIWIEEARGLQKIDQNLDAYLRGDQPIDTNQQLYWLTRVSSIRERDQDIGALLGRLEQVSDPIDPNVLRAKVIVACMILREGLDSQEVPNKRTQRDKALTLLNQLLDSAQAAGHPQVIAFLRHQIKQEGDGECKRLLERHRPLDADEEQAWETFWKNVESPGTAQP